MLFLGERIFARAKSTAELNSLLASSRGIELGISADRIPTLSLVDPVIEDERDYRVGCDAHS